MLKTIEHVDLNERVYIALRDQLLAREFAPGEKLSLHSLAQEFAVSRSPVHAALTRLVSEGFLTVEPRRGYFVMPLTAKVVEEAYDVRLALELMASERSVGFVDKQDLKRLRARMEAMVVTSRDGGRGVRPERWHTQNREFHELQVDLAHNTLLSDLYRRAAIYAVMERAVRGEPGPHMEIVLDQHEQLVQAFEAADIESVQATIRDHNEIGRAIARETLELRGGSA